MRNKHRKFIYLSVILTVMSLMTYLSFVYILDPEGINNRFDIGLIKEEAVTDGRTKKFVGLTTFKPDTIMLGGSRTQFMDTRDVQKYTKDRVYNVAMNSSNLEEQYLLLDYALNNFSIKNVIIGLNFYTFNGSHTESPKIDEELFAEGFTLKKHLNYYLSLPIVNYLKNEYKFKYTEPLYLSGSRSQYNQNMFINNISWTEREKGSNDTYKRIYATYTKIDPKKLELLKKMVQLCKDHHVDLKIFTTAIYQSQFDLLKNPNKLDIYFACKRDIANITNYYDFMYPNSVTRNKNYYIDPSHLKQEYGYWYFSKIFNDSSVSVPSDFGVYVTPENIDSHIDYLKQVSQ